MENITPNTHSTPLPEYLNPQIILFWKAPLRPYKKRAKHVLRFYIAVALLLSAIIFFFGDRILLIPIWSLLFLFYTLTITPPPIVDNKITRFGLETAGITMRWETLSHFFFTQRFGYDILTVVTHAPYSLHAYMVVPTQEVKKEVMQIMSEHIMFQDQPQRTFTDRMIDWLSKLIPDDDEEIVVSDAEKKSTFGNNPVSKVDSPEKPVDTLWGEIKNSMHFMHNEDVQEKIPSAQKEVSLDDNQNQVKQEKIQVKTEEKKEVPQNLVVQTEDSIKAKLETKADISKEPAVTPQADPSSFDPTPMPESLLRHISEPNAERPRQS